MTVSLSRLKQGDRSVSPKNIIHLFLAKFPSDAMRSDFSHAVVLRMLIHVISFHFWLFKFSSPEHWGLEGSVQTTAFCHRSKYLRDDGSDVGETLTSTGSSMGRSMCRSMGTGKWLDR